MGVPIWYNVKDYGAAGDGITNDTAAIQAAINVAVAGGGGVIYVPPGTYIVAKEYLRSSFDLNNVSNLVFQGDGNASITKNKPGDVSGDWYTFSVRGVQTKFTSAT